MYVYIEYLLYTDKEKQEPSKAIEGRVKAPFLLPMIRHHARRKTAQRGAVGATAIFRRYFRGIREPVVLASPGVA